MLKVPQTTILRLSLYLREVKRLKDMDVDFVSSHRISRELGFSDAQIRRDLNYFGQFGVSGRGYDVNMLKDALSDILGIAKGEWNVALVGVGNLGSALLSYRGFRQQGFVIKAAFDKSLDKIGITIDGLRIMNINNIYRVIKKNKIKIGIITVPAVEAQNVADILVKGGVRAILNFAPAKIQVPPGIILRNVDLSTELEILSYHLSRKRI